MKLASNIKRLGRRITNGTLAVLFLLFSANLVPLAKAFAGSAPGNNGTLKVHEIGTPTHTTDNDPKVCAFNFEGFGFDVEQSGYIMITVQGNDAPHGQDAGPFAFGPTVADNDYTSYAISQDFNNGNGTTTILNGHYTATLYGKDASNNIDLTDVKAKSKDFKVDCGVTPVEPTLTTRVSMPVITLGDSVYDTATLTGTQTNGDVTGTVDFYACGPTVANEDCTTGGTLVTSGVTVTSGSATSGNFTPTATGSYCFRAEYTPDATSDYLAVTETDNNTECFTVNSVPVYGSITIKKNAVPDSSQAFHFTTTGLSTDATGFDLIDDSTTGLPQQVFSKLGAGTYTVSETATSGWDFAGITCTNDGATVTTTGSTVSIALSGAQNVVCTYTNKERGTITVYKVTDPANDPTSFPIKLAHPAGATVTETLSQTLTTSTPVVYHVSQGTYGVTEDLSNLPNWQTTNNGCSSVTVNSSNLNATCTITNTKHTSISGTKWQVNADGSTVGSTGLPGWTINLYKNGTATGQTAITGNDGSYSFNNLVDDGTYTVEETNQTGWIPICSAYLKNICGDNPYDFGNMREPTATVTIIKKAYPVSPLPFGFTTDLLGSTLSFGLTDNGNDTTLASRKFTEVAPGTYTISETELPGWALLSANCGPGVTTSLNGTVLTLQVPAGAVMTCTFTNQQQGGHVLGASIGGSGAQLVNTGKDLLVGVMASLTILGTALAVAVSRKQQATR